MKFTRPVLLTTLSLALSLGSAQAVVVNFDFNFRLADDSNVGAGALGDTYLGLGAAPDSASNTHWNSVRRTGSTGASAVSSASGLNNNPAGGGPIRDSSGLATSVDILLASTTNANGNTTIGHQRSANQQELGNALQYEDLMADFLQLSAPGTEAQANVGTINGLINGLIPGAYYEIYFYGQGANYAGGSANASSGANSLFAITDAFGGSIIGSAQQTGWSAADGVLTEGVEYVKFATNANATGEIFFIWQNVVAGKNVVTDLAPDSTGGSSRLAALNAIQVVSVPEPSAALLAGLGVLALALRRRRL